MLQVNHAVTGESVCCNWSQSLQLKSTHGLPYHVIVSVSSNTIPTSLSLYNCQAGAKLWYKLNYPIFPQTFYKWKNKFKGIWCKFLLWFSKQNIGWIGQFQDITISVIFAVDTQHSRRKHAWWITMPGFQPTSFNKNNCGCICMSVGKHTY